MDLHVSYECPELIEEIKEDIREFEESAPAYAVWEKKLVKVPFLDKSDHVDALIDYLIGNEPPTNLFDGEVAVLSTLEKIYDTLIKQNKIVLYSKIIG